MKSAKAAIEAAKGVAKNVIAFPLTRETREKEELAFLPAALEIVDTPPSPIGRAIGATLVVLFCLALIWASFGHVDIIAYASGKVVPSGRVKLIQPFEIGVVRAIHVRDGQAVKAGDVLIELDPTMSAAEEEPHKKRPYRRAARNCTVARGTQRCHQSGKCLHAASAAQAQISSRCNAAFCFSRPTNIERSLPHSINNVQRRRPSAIPPRRRLTSSKLTSRSSASASTSAKVSWTRS